MLLNLMIYSEFAGMNLRESFTREEGQGLVEYALIIALISIVLIAILSVMTGALNGIFNRVASALNGV